MFPRPGQPPFPAPETAFPDLCGLTLGVDAVAARQLRRRRQLIGTGAVEDPGVDLGTGTAVDLQAGWDGKKLGEKSWISRVGAGVDVLEFGWRWMGIKW